MKKIDTAIILAGGKSTRMGFDKQFLKIGDKLLIEDIREQLQQIFEEIIIVTNKPEAYDGFSCRIVEDQLKGCGPLGGIHAGLKNSSNFYNYVVACDMPWLNRSYIDYMKKLLIESPHSWDAVVARFGPWIEPMNGFYSKHFVQKIEQSVAQNQRKISTILEESKTIYIPEVKAREFSPNWEMFMNLNTEEELEKYFPRKEEEHPWM